LADIKNRSQFEAWLRKQPREVAVALAARVALRVLPVVQTAKGYKGCLVVAVFRATAVSWSKAKYPAHETELAAYAAAAYAAAVVAAAVRTAAAYAAVAATRAGAGAAHAAVYADARAYAVAGASADAATTASAAGYASDAAIRYFWSALSIDATRVEKGKKTCDVAGSPLWPHGQPDELRTLWQELAAGLLAAKQDWRVWTNWYEDRLDGRFREEERELGYVRIDEFLWGQNPAIVNAEIKRRFDERAPPATAG